MQSHNLGVLAMTEGKVEEALSFFKTALEANPEVEQFWASYIDALVKQERFDTARQVLAQAENKEWKGRESILWSYSSQSIRQHLVL